MKNISKYIKIVICVTLLASCKPKMEVSPEYTGGDQLDLSVYVAIGEGTTSGYTNGALSRDGQMASVPTYLSEQFKLVGGLSGQGGKFNQPLLPPGESIGFEKGKLSTTMHLRPMKFCDGTLEELYPILLDSTSNKITDQGTQLAAFNTLSDQIKLESADNTPYYNLGANGAKVIYINKKGTPFMDGWDDGNSEIFWSLFRKSENITILEEAVARKPTFFTIQLGATDVMRYAKSGGNQEGGIGISDELTPPQEFEDSLRVIVNSLTANGAKGAIANILDLSSYPYISHRKWNDLILSNALATSLTTYYIGKGDYTFIEGRNAYVMEDSLSSNGHRRMTKNDYLMIEVPLDSLKCYGLGAEKPFGKRWVLDKNEAASAQSTIDQYNIIIANIANEKNLALVNQNEMITDIVNGIKVQGKEVSNEYPTGGAFSLDALNISPLGSALLANKFIDAINIKYDSNLPLFDVSNIGGVHFN